ncbi:MAG: hypothetical protein V3R35_08575 [Woeseiaceae bacterium]
MPQWPIAIGLGVFQPEKPVSNNIRELIDSSRLSGLQITVVAVCFFLNMLEEWMCLRFHLQRPAVLRQGVS